MASRMTNRLRSRRLICTKFMKADKELSFDLLTHVDAQFARLVLAQRIVEGERVMDFGFSDKAKGYIERLTAFMDKHVLPSEGEYYRTLTTGAQPWNVPPVMQDLKDRAKAEGLWNLFMPEPEYGPGLSNAEYAPLAEITGRVPFAPEIFNCN